MVVIVSEERGRVAINGELSEELNSVQLRRSLTDALTRTDGDSDTEEPVPDSSQHGSLIAGETKDCMKLLRIIFLDNLLEKFLALTLAISLAVTKRALTG